jgi:hypothetical protein
MIARILTEFRRELSVDPNTTGCTDPWADRDYS